MSQTPTFAQWLKTKGIPQAALKAPGVHAATFSQYAAEVLAPQKLKTGQAVLQQAGSPTPARDASFWQNMAEKMRMPAVKAISTAQTPTTSSLAGLTAEQKFHKYIEMGLIPAGSLYAGQTQEDKTEPMYYETTQEQLQKVEQQFIEDSKDAPIYIYELMKRVGMTPVSKDYDELKKQWDSLSAKQKQKLLSVYYWQATQEEGRAIPVSLPKTAMMYVGAAGEYIQKEITEHAQNLPPGFQAPTILATSVITTIGEMTAMLPLMAAEISQNPSFVKDVAVGMKDFTVDAAKGVGEGDPWAVGEMAVIVGTLYLSSKPLVNAVKTRAPAWANRIKVVMADLDTAIRSGSESAIRRAGNNLRNLGQEMLADEMGAIGRNIRQQAEKAIKAEDIVRTARENEARINQMAEESLAELRDMANMIEELGKRAEEQAGHLSTLSVKTINDIKLSMENAVSHSQGVGRVRWKPQPRKTISPEEIGVTEAQFARLIQIREALRGLTEAQKRPFENWEFDALLRDSLRNAERAGDKVRIRNIEQIMKERTRGGEYELPKPPKGLGDVPYKGRTYKTGKEEAAEVAEAAWREAEGKKWKQSEYYRKWLRESERIKRKVDEEYKPIIDKWKAEAKARQIVEKAMENEAKIKDVAEKSLNELEKMRQNTTLARFFDKISPLQLTAMFAVGTGTMLRKLNKLNTRQRNEVLSNVDPDLATYVQNALAGQTAAGGAAGITTKTSTASTSDVQNAAQTELEDEILDDVITDVVPTPSTKTSTPTPTPTPTPTTTTSESKTTKSQTKPLEETRPKKGRRRGKDDEDEGLRVERVEGIPEDPGIVEYDRGTHKVTIRPPYIDQGTGGDSVEFKLLKEPQTGEGSQEATLRTHGGDAPRLIVLSESGGVVETHIMDGKTMKHYQKGHGRKSGRQSQRGPRIVDRDGGVLKGRGPGIVTKSGRVVHQKRGSIVK